MDFSVLLEALGDKSPFKTRVGREAFQVSCVCRNKENCNSYIERNVDFVKYWVTAAKVLRLQGGISDEEVAVVYALIGSLFCLSDVSLDYVPASHYKIFASHFVDVMGHVAHTPHWQATGVLQQPEECLMNCAVLMAKDNREHINALLSVDNPQKQCAFSILAKLCAAHVVGVVQAIDIVRLATAGLILKPEERGNRDEENYDLFHHYDATGFLGHVFVCMAVAKRDTEQQNIGNWAQVFLECLSGQLRLVKKKLHPGTKTGDMLKAIVSGYDEEECESNPIMKALWCLHRQALDSDCPEKSGYVKPKKTRCNNCNNICGKPKICAGCHDATYCSRDCQIAHWKAHKPFCKKSADASIKGKMQRNMKAMNASILAFLETNYIPIMTNLAAFTRRHGLGCSFEAVLLEVDLLVTPATFKIGKIDLYLEGSRPSKPKWTTATVDAVLDEITRSISLAGNKCRLQCLVRRPDGGISVLPLPDYTKWTTLALQYFPLEADEKNRGGLKTLVARQIEMSAVIQAGGDLAAAMKIYYKNLSKQAKSGSLDPSLFDQMP